MSAAPRLALLSAFDKSGIAEIARAFLSYEIGVMATGGTAALLEEEGCDILSVESLTGFPEMMAGRVKTLHPKIHGGILARRSEKEDQEAMRRHHIPAIDFVIVDFYPFEEAARAGASFADCLERIDIGAPAMARGAAKNHASVTVITEREDYPRLLEELARGEGRTSPDFRRAMAAKAFRRTSLYDSAIADWLAEEGAKGRLFRLSGEKRFSLRYGENPHQKAALYSFGRGGVAEARQIQGKLLSYNNLADADAGLALAEEFAEPAAVIIKHANPSGAAEKSVLADAYEGARLSDPVSAFGGIVALNRPLDARTAARIAEIFTELVAAPSFAPEALRLLAKKSSLRLLEVSGSFRDDSPSLHAVSGGFLVQDPDLLRVEEEALRPATKRRPSKNQIRDCLFAWRVAKHVKSNAIVVARDRMTVGVGAGQMSRVDSARIAVRKAGRRAEGAVAASDAFFPFADGLEILAEAGVKAVIQPGGSRRDEEVIEAAEKHDLAMVFTGARHFKH